MVHNSTDAIWSVLHAFEVSNCLDPNEDSTTAGFQTRLIEFHCDQTVRRLINHSIFKFHVVKNPMLAVWTIFLSDWLAESDAHG
jgi:hypothetical protein